MMRSLLAGIALLVAIGCSGPASETKSTAPAGDQASSQPGPTLTPEEIAKTVEVPLYPGATAPDGLSRAPAKDQAGDTRYELVLRTADPVEKVAAWYEKETKLEGMREGGSAQLIGKTASGHDAMITITPDESEKGKTRIRVAAIVYQK